MTQDRTAEAREVLRRELPDLYAAALPLKGEVYVICGSRALAVHDAIKALLATPAPQPVSVDEGLVERLFAAGITKPVRVVCRVTRGNGTEMWSEVHADERADNSQVAHCADDEDANLIAYLINAAISREAGEPQPITEEG